MDDDDRPPPRGDLASRLASESLDSYSQDELEFRMVQLDAEIVRTRTHMEKAAAHRQAADALFGRPSSSSPPA